MKAKFNSQSGMSLVEVTIILMVLAILTAVIAPSAGDYVNDARAVKAKEDVEAIGTGLLRMLRDTGLPCATKDAASATPCSGTNRRELLTSSDAVGTNEPKVTGAAFGSTLANNKLSNTLNWAGDTSEVADAFRDTLDNQLVTNTLATSDYKTLSFTARGISGRGWRGGYLAGPIGLDPWGYAYQVSSAFLAVASDAATADVPAEGGGFTGWANDVIVVSAGPNASIATPFGGLATAAVGDDIIYVVKGATR
jgi:type II secretory pathway pseudopilin PulG